MRSIPKKEKTPTGCLFFFDYDYDFNLQYYARATKLYHRALCLERERARWAMKRVRQGNKQGVAQPIGRDTTMFMTERGRRLYLVISTKAKGHPLGALFIFMYLKISDQASSEPEFPDFSCGYQRECGYA
jgi:hypothetical protein